VTELDEGLLVSVLECEVFEQVLNELASRLADAGVTGTFSAWEPVGQWWLPVRAPHVSARLVPCGERQQRSPRFYQWRPEESAFRELLARAVNWCHWNGDADGRTLSSPPGPIPIAADENVVDRMVDAMASGSNPEFAARRGAEMRGFSVDFPSGWLSLIGTIDEESSMSWRRPVRELRELLQECAHASVYGFVKRGWDIDHALHNPRLPRDWPKREDAVPGGVGFSATAFADLVSSDVFGIQLLGPGYADRFTAHDGWRITPLADERWLLEHEDLDAWFSEPFVPTAARGSKTPAPPLLDRSRDQYATILHTRTALSDFGFEDMSREPR
jgi:hypothetical protein